MSFVGILCSPKQEGYIKQILNSSLQGINIIVLKEETIENFKNITFETIAIFSNHLPTKIEALQKIIEKAKYLIINSDEEMPYDFIKNAKGNVITYGFNAKSTVTASSVKEDSMLICLQRNIQNYVSKIIEPQEILVNILSHKSSASSIMGIVSVLLIYGKTDIIIQ